jgi:gamma-glutamylcyclotransferase (GGCT)/AIG2-like uncharacterized protein YtfP
MPLLFSYGTLQQENVQLATFGRLLRGATDELRRFAPALVKINDAAVVATSGRTHHANAAFTGDDRSRVTGTVFEITETELANADEYERQASYGRVWVTLASGRQAWIYVHASPLERGNDGR